MNIVQKIGKKNQLENGEYNPWNFEQEDLEEGDYYYEDIDINPKYYDEENNQN